MTVTSISIIKSDVFMCEIDDSDGIRNLHIDCVLCTVYHAHFFVDVFYFLLRFCSFHFDLQWFFTVTDRSISFAFNHVQGKEKKQEYLNRDGCCANWIGSEFGKSTPVKMTMYFGFFLAVIFFAEDYVTLFRIVRVIEI